MRITKASVAAGSYLSFPLSIPLPEKILLYQTAWKLNLCEVCVCVAFDTIKLTLVRYIIVTKAYVEIRNANKSAICHSIQACLRVSQRLWLLALAPSSLIGRLLISTIETRRYRAL